MTTTRTAAAALLCATAEQDHDRLREVLDALAEDPDTTRAVLAGLAEWLTRDTCRRWDITPQWLAILVRLTA